MLSYIATFNNKKEVILASSWKEAQFKAAVIFKVPRPRAYIIDVKAAPTPRQPKPVESN